MATEKAPETEALQVYFFASQSGNDQHDLYRLVAPNPATAAGHMNLEGVIPIRKGSATSPGLLLEDLSNQPELELGIDRRVVPGSDRVVLSHERLVALGHPLPIVTELGKISITRPAHPAYTQTVREQPVSPGAYVSDALFIACAGVGHVRYEPNPAITAA